MIGTLMDVHERRSQEIMLRESNAELSVRSTELSQTNALKGAMLDSAGYAIMTADLDGLIHIFNPAAESMLGYRAEETPGFYLGDDLKTRQVLLNLVGNAIKFTPERGSVILHSALESNEVGEYWLRFTVTDTGIGIPQNKVGLVFAPFAQADSGTTRKFGGTGLGLPISRMRAELMGGNVSVSSQEGVGSAFDFTTKVQVLNADENPSKAATNDFTSTDDRQGAKPILLVEDNLINQRLASKILEKLGHTVVIANNGQEALHRLAKEPAYFAIVLMDCQMPVLSGYDATRIIRQLETNTELHLPIIAMTGNAMDGDREKCIVAGMDDYLTKPIERVRLAEMIAKYSRV